MTNRTRFDEDGPTFWVAVANQEAHYAGFHACGRRFDPEWWTREQRCSFLVDERVWGRERAEAHLTHCEALADDGDAVGLSEEDVFLWGTPGCVTVFEHMTTWEWMERFTMRYEEGQQCAIVPAADIPAWLQAWHDVLASEGHRPARARRKREA